ncbi:6-hydroxynicotinate 3-monooxygenase [Cyphellophora attinorum]|uniref:6-hydroxynicotinate 3-monooxygenase n=1 Tax=Cyphellophora attinorum TaxID=1664694 RepID=A0A0N1HW41_9EURO|nr:6-hydroxynicotinate 3-monooxygenase [Phialophora attinorum]KPI41703.1 6-hydroxynicotinate 3-monooxygenase [Phialophora attinorum]
MLLRLGRCGVANKLLTRVARSAYSTRIPFHRETVKVSIGGSGHVDLEIQARISDTESRPSVLLQLPAGSRLEAPADPQEAPPDNARLRNLHSAIITIHYRLSSPLPLTATAALDHRFPMPVHDVHTSFAYLTSTILPGLFPYALEEPRIDVAGSSIGGALATTLALTEPNALNSVTITDALVDWCMLDEHAGIVEEAPPGNYLRGQRKKAPPSVDPEAIQTAARALIAARTRLFPTPSSFFDPFASPMLFLRAPGRDTPRTHAEALGLVTSSQEAEPEPHDTIAYGPYNDDHDPTRVPSIDSLADSMSNMTLQQQQNRRRRKVIRRWPPIGVPEDVMLPRFQIFSRPPRNDTDGHGWLLHKQATDLADYLRRACFCGREKGFAEDRGFTDIHIFEASSRLTTLGVGINVQPSAVLILRNLGLLPTLLSTGIQTKELNFYDRHGNPILSEPRGLSAGYTIPQFSIHRGELQQLLRSAVEDRLGKDTIHLNHAFTSYTQDANSVTAHFTQRSTGELATDHPSITGDILIAADGINSHARKLHYPTEGPPRFSGRILWRGCIELPNPYLTGASMIWDGHANQKFIAYPISARSASEGKSLVNWIAELRVRDESDPDLTPPPPADWTRSVPKETFQEPFRKWRCGGLRMMEDLIEPTGKVYEFPMCDRDPVERWSFGRMTLLGDAAHAMYPIGSNGASQAILDAECLAACLVEHTSGAGDVDVEAALTTYQTRRLPPTAAIVMANRGNGPDQVLQLAHERAPEGFDDIYSVVPKDELEAVGSVYKKIAGFEMEKVNARAAETVGEERRWFGADKANGEVDGHANGQVEGRARHVNGTPA